MTPVEPGTTLGTYRVVEQIGMGGMATIFKAYQPSMDRYVALKILPAHFAHDPGFTARFNREAQTIARLEHKHILPVYDYGEENGVTYLVMRYLEGGTLKDLLAQRRPSLAETVDIMTQVCAALDYAHRQGVVHRDVKPANILIDLEGDAYLSDFGIAKVLEGVTGHLTETGATVGTPAYMAPEQSMGQQVDARSDIYALGVVLYEMLVGRLPYQADTPMAVALMHIHNPLPLPRQVAPSLSEAFENVILKALAKQPTDRFQSAGQMAAALKEALSQSGAGAPAATQSILSGEEDRPTRRSDERAFAGPSETLLVPPERRFPLVPVLVGGGLLIVLLVGAALLLPRLLSGDATASLPDAPTATSAAAAATSTAPAEGQPTATPEEAPASTAPADLLSLPPAVPISGTLVDAFDDPAFDGAFDSDRWQFASWGDGPCTFTQAAGVLAVSDAPTAGSQSCLLQMASTSNIPADQFQMFGGSVMMRGDHNRGYVENFIRLEAYYDGDWWYADCGLVGSADGVVQRFWIRNVAADSTEQLQGETQLPAEYDRWYSVELRFDPLTEEVACLIDGAEIARVKPDHFAANPSPVFNGVIAVWRDPESAATTLVDNFVMLP